jgi:hypothetical protein
MEGIEQLNLLIDETTSRVRGDVAVAPVDDALMFLLGELDVFDGTVAGFTGAFEQDRERPIIAGGRVAIIEDPGPSEEQHRGADRGP